MQKIKSKFSKKAAVLLIIAAAAILAAIVLISGSSEISGTKYGKSHGVGLKTNDDRISFLSGLGWEVESEPISEQDIVIPRVFSEVYSQYNELQIQQGYDLSEYCGLEAKLYTYKVTNYPNYYGSVELSLYIMNYQVIGGDVHATAIDGFMHGLK